MAAHPWKHDKRRVQISDPKGRYLVFTLLFFQMPIMKTQDLNTKIITKKPKNARNCESRVRYVGAGAVCNRLQSTVLAIVFGLWETVFMPKRNLRILKKPPATVGICEACNQRFTSHLRNADKSEWEVSTLFSRHKCKSQDVNRTAARTVKESTEGR